LNCGDSHILIILSSHLVGEKYPVAIKMPIPGT
jgi:hypothetical protein